MRSDDVAGLVVAIDLVGVARFKYLEHRSEEVEYLDGSFVRKWRQWYAMVGWIVHGGLAR